MRHSAIRLLMLGTCVMAMAAAATEGGASSRHIRKHQYRTSFDLHESVRNSSAAGEVRTMAPPPRLAGTACPGNARGFDCKIWPPPFDDDPDRKSGDGGP